MRCHFTVKGVGLVRKEQYRLLLLEYPHLAARVTKQYIFDQKREIRIRRLLSEMVKTVEEDDETREEHGRGHYVFGEVVYSHMGRFRKRVDDLFEKKSLFQNIYKVFKETLIMLYGGSERYDYVGDILC